MLQLWMIDCVVVDALSSEIPIKKDWNLGRMILIAMITIVLTML